MSRDIELVREMASSGAEMLDIIEHLKESKAEKLTPMAFLAIIQEALGISFVQTRRIYQYLDPELRPLSAEAEAEANRIGNEILQAHRKPDARA